MEPVKLLEPIVERLRSTGAKTVFGEPIQAAGKTIVPVAVVAYGFGGGSHNGRQNDEDCGKPSEGGGAGGGAKAMPAGVLEVTESCTRFIYFVPVWRIVGAASLALLLGIKLGRMATRR